MLQVVNLYIRLLQERSYTSFFGDDFYSIFSWVAIELFARSLQFGGCHMFKVRRQDRLPEEPVGQLRAGIHERGINDDRDQGVWHTGCQFSCQGACTKTQDERGQERSQEFDLA